MLGLKVCAAITPLATCIYFVCVYMGIHMSQYSCGIEKTGFWESVLSMRVLEIKLRSLALAATPLLAVPGHWVKLWWRSSSVLFVWLTRSTRLQQSTAAT